MDIVKKLTDAGVVPVIVIDDAENAVPTAKALLDGGIDVVEITFRTAAAKEAIEQISKAFPQMLIIAGTVLTTAQADDAINAGAAGIVAPGYNPTVVDYCLKKGYPIFPGVCTPSEIEVAMEKGLTYLKFFPAQAAGGVKYIKAISAPYPNVKFMPTGGITPENLNEYLNCKAVFTCGGSYIAPKDKIADKKFDEIKETAVQTVKLVKEIRK